MRSGFFCNPGAGEAAFGLAADDLQSYFRNADFTFDDLRAWYRAERGFDIGGMRISFGVPSTFRDAWSWLGFLRGLLDRTTHELGTTPGGLVEPDTVCAG
jgi:hypothetical protein